MREECKHFQSRTYDSGEVARFCVLDSAEDIVNSVAPDVLAEVRAEDEKSGRKWWRRKR